MLGVCFAYERKLNKTVNNWQFGEVDIDGSLVAAQRNGLENIMMLNNGCLCCTVRGDLVEMIEELVNTKRDLFDHILIETTGMFCQVTWKLPSSRGTMS